jgi:hypothetical protein
MCVRRNGDEKFIANGAKNKMKKEWENQWRHLWVCERARRGKKMYPINSKSIKLCNLARHDGDDFVHFGDNFLCSKIVPNLTRFAKFLLDYCT